MITAAQYPRHITANESSVHYSRIICLRFLLLSGVDMCYSYMVVKRDSPGTLRGAMLFTRR